MGVLETPYKGLMPYAEEDGPYFFGREAEQQTIIANLMASRLTVLYGPSGVGKSSVLRAGVAFHLDELARQNLSTIGTPESIVVVFSGWRDNPLAGLIECVEQAIVRALDLAQVPATPATGSLVETLRTWSERVDADLLIILDQFEEYFLYHPQDDGEEPFAVEFPRAVNRPDLRASFLIAIREDALAKLDRFKGRVPSLFDNYLRVDHLDREAARGAIEQPIEQYNRLHANGRPAQIEPALVEAVLDQVKIGQVTLGDAGRGGVEESGTARAGDQIETPYLQLVMTRLWDEEQHGEDRRDGAPWSGGPLLRLETLRRLGGAERIVHTHLDAVMGGLSPGEQETAAAVFHFLVTASGTKIAHTAADLADYTALPEAEIARVLERLSAADIRVLRPVVPPPGQSGPPRYEIFHDVLAAAVLDWRARYVQMQERAEVQSRLDAERRRVNRLRLAVAGLSLVVLAMIGLLLFAFQQRASAERAQREANTQRAEAEAQRDAAERAKTELIDQQQIAFARELAETAIDKAPTDPELSILLAAEAHAVRELPQTVDALRRSVLAMHGRTVLRGHTDAVISAEFGPDGTTAVTAGNDGTARLWDASRGTLIQELRGHTDSVRAAEFSPDGRLVVTAGDDRTARVWDAASGDLVAVLTGHTSSVRTARFHPTSERPQVLTASWDGTVRLWDAMSGAALLELRGHSGGVHDAIFSSDGAWIASASTDESVRVWDAVNGALLAELRGHSGPVRSVAFSEDNRRLITAGNDGSARIWEPASGALVSVLTGHTGPVISAVFGRDGQLALTAGADGTVRIWNVGSSTAIAELRGHGAEVFKARFSPDGETILTAGRDGTARIWDVDTARVVTTLTGHHGPVWVAGFSPSGRLVITAGQDGMARIWPAADQNVTELRGHAAEIAGVTFSQDSRWAATAGNDQRVLLWDAASGRQRASLQGHPDAMQAVALSPDGMRIATAGADDTVRVWDVAGGQEVAVLAGHKDTIVSIEYSQDGKQIVTASGAGSVRIWDAVTGQPVSTITASPYGIDRVSFNPAGTHILAVDRNNSVSVWDVRTEKEVVRLIGGHLSKVRSAAFNRDGTQIVTSANDLTTRIWDVTTGRQIQHLADFQSVVLSAAFLGDGQRVVTVSEDGTVQVWEVATGKRVLDLRGPADGVRAAAVSPDGTLIMADADRVARMYPREVLASAAELRELAESRATRRLYPEERQRYLRETDDTAADVPSVPSTGTAADGWTVEGSSFEAGTNQVATHNGTASRYIKSTAAPPQVVGALFQSVSAEPYRGKTVRLSGDLRTDRVEGSAGLWMAAVAANDAALRTDSLRRRRPIVGSSDWNSYEIVLQVPERAEKINFGAALGGKGRILVNGLRLEVVGEDTPPSDPLLDAWIASGADPLDYDMRIEEGAGPTGTVIRNLKSLSPYARTFGAATHGFPADQYRGKRLRMTAFVRSNTVEGWAGLWMRVDNSKGSVVIDNMYNSQRPIRGDTEWTRYQIVLDVPNDATQIAYGCLLSGVGEVWFDEPQFEIVGADVPVTYP